MKLSTLNTKTLKALGTGATIVGAIVSLASALIEPALNEREMEAMIAEKLKLKN